MAERVVPAASPAVSTPTRGQRHLQVRREALGEVDRVGLRHRVAQHGDAHRGLRALDRARPVAHALLVDADEPFPLVLEPSGGAGPQRLREPRTVRGFSTPSPGPEPTASVTRASSAPPGTITTEPFSGIATLSYQLPFPGYRGDVVMYEPGIQPAPITDVLRFDGNFFVYFFSERETSDTPPFDPADVGQFPGPFPGPSFNLLEAGVEGADGAFYTPGNNPGGDASNPSYRIISDVPEPGSGLLLSLGGGLLWLLKGRRQETHN